MFNISIAQIILEEIKSTLPKSLFYNYYSTNQIKSKSFCRERKTGVPGEKPHRRVENQQTRSTYDCKCGNRTRATLVEGKCSH